MKKETLYASFEAVAKLTVLRSCDKQERTVGRSKVVRKFLYRNFLPPEVQKGMNTCSPFSQHLQSKCCFICALPREMLEKC